jgi:predicted O-linked N-acetylglucosamine transferase (SPINDLY family)
LGIHITLRKFYEAVFPYLFHDATKNKKTTPDGAASGEKTGVKKRLGIMSNSLYCADFTNHSVSKVFSGVIQQLDREVYDIFIFGFTSGISNAKNPNLNGSSEESVTFVELKTIRNEPLQTTMTRWHSTVEGMHLDMLLYLDIGMDPYTYMLSFARLAPIQVTTWGHPDCHATTMDYYITSTVFNNDPKLHREKLVYMDGCSFSFEKPYGLLERPKMNRSEFGIPENFHVYMCAQSIFKITPAFDPVVIGILERDANGIVVFLDTEASGFFRETIQRRLQKYAHRLLFIPKVPSVEYVACCRMADVLLDAFPFSGGITSLECFAAGLPIVTMNMPHIRGSQTTSYYRLMGFTDLIGNDVEQYVKNAVRLAKDREFKTHCANTIHAKKKVLYNNSDVGDKWNRLLLDLCALQST